MARKKLPKVFVAEALDERPFDPVEFFSMLVSVPVRVADVDAAIAGHRAERDSHDPLKYGDICKLGGTQ